MRTARALIERQGAERLALADVAAVCGIKAPSLYRHVPSKAALIQTVNALTFQLLFDAYNTALAAAPSHPHDRLRALCRAHRAFAHANPRTYILAFTTTTPEERADERVLEQRALPIQAIMAELVGAVRSLPALRGALALIHGFVMLELNEQFRRGGDLPAAFEAAIDAYLAGWQQVEVPPA